MAHIYKTIIIGATPEGIKLAESMDTNDRSTLLLSKNFKYLKPKHAFTKVELLEAEAIFMSYNHGLFGINIRSTKGDGAVYGTNVVFATGTSAEKLNLSAKNIVYNELDISGKHKNKAAVVYGSGDTAAKYAINLAKRFAYVYICTPEVKLLCSTALKHKINDTANIMHLPNCNVIDCRINKAGQLTEVLLDTYSSIRAGALVAATPRKPDIPSFATKYLVIDDSGHALPVTAPESIAVPGAYALGAICTKNTTQEITKLANILN